MTSPRDAANAGRTLTPLLRFEAKGPFRLRQNNTSAPQFGKAGGFVTTSALFVRDVVARNPGLFAVREARAALPCLPRAAWAETDFTGMRVLFLLPSDALGSNVCTLLFLQAFRDRWKPKQVSVFCTRSSADIYALDTAIRQHALWLPEAEVERHDVLIDLGQLESRRDVEIWPVEMEAELLEAFGLPPSERYPGTATPMKPKGRPKIGLFPLASSPLRTLPFTVTEALCRALAAEADVLVSLNKLQHQGRLYREALEGRLPKGARIVEGCESISELMGLIRRCDYAVFADSGPAHMSKLFRTPGVAVYTSAPGDVLQGRFTNLRAWTVDFKGPHCQAPCGLAKLRITTDGRIGCMGSLGVPLDALPAVATASDADAVERLLVREPVPCVAALAEQADTLAAFVVDDLRERRTA